MSKRFNIQLSQYPVPDLEAIFTAYGKLDTDGMSEGDKIAVAIIENTLSTLVIALTHDHGESFDDAICEWFDQSGIGQ